jgi:hypothetical protein
MEQYSIIGISGSVDSYIVDTFRMLGVTAAYNGSPDKKLSDFQTAVIVSYGHGGFAWTMTSHLLNHVHKLKPEEFIYWKRHWVGEDDVTCKEDITPDRWAKHVLTSHKHIGAKEPLNGLYIELEKRINNDKCPRYEIKLEDIVSNPEKALSDIGLIVNREIPENVREFFLREHRKKKEIMAPWMNALVLQNNGSKNLTINHFGYIIHLLID